MPNKEVGPVCCVVGDGESWVLAEASQLFPVFVKYVKYQAKVGLVMVNLPPLELDLIKELLKGRMVPAPGHLRLPQLLLHHHGLGDLKQQLEVPCPTLVRSSSCRLESSKVIFSFFRTELLG